MFKRLAIPRFETITEQPQHLVFPTEPQRVSVNKSNINGLPSSYKFSIEFHQQNCIASYSCAAALVSMLSEIDLNQSKEMLLLVLLSPSFLCLYSELAKRGKCVDDLVLGANSTRFMMYISFGTILLSSSKSLFYLIQPVNETSADSDNHHRLNFSWDWFVGFLALNLIQFPLLNKLWPEKYYPELDTSFSSYLVKYLNTNAFGSLEVSDIFNKYFIPPVMSFGLSQVFLAL